MPVIVCLWLALSSAVTPHLNSPPGVRTVLVSLAFFTRDESNMFLAKQANAYFCALQNGTMEVQDGKVVQEERISVTVQEGAELPLHCLRLDAPQQPDLWKEQYKV